MYVCMYVYHDTSLASSIFSLVNCSNNPFCTFWLKHKISLIIYIHARIDINECLFSYVYAYARMYVYVCIHGCFVVPLVQWLVRESFYACRRLVSPWPDLQCRGHVASAYILYEYIYMYVYMYIFCYHKFKFRLGWPRINLPDGFAVRCVCFALSGEHRKVVLTEPDADPRPAVWWVGVSYPTLQRTVSDAEVRARRSAAGRHLPCQSLCWFPKVRSR